MSFGGFKSISEPVRTQQLPFFSLEQVQFPGVSYLCDYIKQSSTHSERAWHIKKIAQFQHKWAPPTSYRRKHLSLRPLESHGIQPSKCLQVIDWKILSFPPPILLLSFTGKKQREKHLELKEQKKTATCLVSSSLNQKWGLVSSQILMTQEK